MDAGHRSQDLRIAVITHAMDRFDKGGYLLHYLGEQWAARGIGFDVVRGPADAPPEADLAICHIDMTRVGDEYARMFEHYPLVINGRIRDISKSVFSDQLITRDDPYDGPVIVKTNRNFGGMRELRARHLEGDPAAIVGVQRPWRKIEFLEAYPVFDRPVQVPAGAWRNSNLVVEKFRPERNEEGEYILRMWVFLGDRGIYYLNVSPDPIVKGKNTTRRVVLNVADVPDSLRKRREELGVDYGKFDFGMIGGEAVLYDVNRTPGLPPQGTEAEKVIRHYPHLSEGLDFYLSKIGKQAGSNDG